jgi:hypothetical protein
MATYSIQYRVQRITTERAYVQVPVTGAVMSVDDGKLDVDKVRAAALALAAEPGVKWHVETVAIDVHPIQGPKEPHET